MCYYGSVNTEYVVQQYFECDGEVFRDNEDAIKKQSESKKEVRPVFIIMQREESVRVQELDEYCEYYNFDEDETIWHYEHNFAHMCEACEEWYDEGIYIRGEVVSDFCSRECMYEHYGEDEAQLFEIEDRVISKTHLKM